MYFCDEELTKKSIGYNPKWKKNSEEFIKVSSLKVYAKFEKNEKPTFEIDKDGNVKILVGKMSVGGVK